MPLRVNVPNSFQEYSRLSKQNKRGYTVENTWKTRDDSDDHENEDSSDTDKPKGIWLYYS